MRTIGIIEDDNALSKELQYFLGTHGFTCIVLPREAYTPEAILQSGCHLLLLDIGLPDTDGMYLCRELRRTSDLPIIMLTSQDTEMTELLSMHSGADDFIAKPFSPHILLARIESVLKRVYKETGEKPLLLGSFTFDRAKGRISRGEYEAELTKNELLILRLLAARQGEIVTRDELINALWDDRQFVDDNTLTVNITRLKVKLENIGVNNAITTKRGMGYQLL